MAHRMPALFVGHGSPMNTVLDNTFTRSLAAWGRRLPRPRAILVVSAHWLTEGTFVSCAERPRTIHDFYGFPDGLYALAYPSPGAPEEAEFVARTVRRVPVGCDRDRGLDHGAWSVLRQLFPTADLPVFQLSVDYSFHDRHPKPLRYHYDLAQELRALRERGVLVVGSGNIVHNLARIDGDMEADPYPWALEFDETVKDGLLAGDHRALLDPRSLGPSAAWAVPAPDHYLPMAYVLALQEKGEPLAFAHEGIQNASISMRCFQIG